MCKSSSINIAYTNVTALKKINELNSIKLSAIVNEQGLEVEQDFTFSNLREGEAVFEMIKGLVNYV